MAGRLVSAASAIVGTATAAGFVTLPSVTGFYKGAKCWISKAGQTSLWCLITEINTTANTLGLRAIQDMGGTQAISYNYGRTDVSAFATTGVVDMPEQLVYNPNDAPAP